MPNAHGSALVHDVRRRQPIFLLADRRTQSKVARNVRVRRRIVQPIPTVGFSPRLQQRRVNLLLLVRKVDPSLVLDAIFSLARPRVILHDDDCLLRRHEIDELANLIRLVRLVQVGTAQDVFRRKLANVSHEALRVLARLLGLAETEIDLGELFVFVPKPLLRTFCSQHVDVGEEELDDFVNASQTFIGEFNRRAKERARRRRIDASHAHSGAQVTR